MAENTSSLKIDKEYGNKPADEVQELVDAGKWSAASGQTGLVVRNEHGQIQAGSSRPIANKADKEMMREEKRALMEIIQERGDTREWYEALMESVRRRNSQSLITWRDTFLGKPMELTEEIEHEDTNAIIKEFTEVMEEAIIETQRQKKERYIE
jgi:NCAIR mutase (PurE)-related protein